MLRGLDIHLIDLKSPLNAKRPGDHPGRFVFIAR